jgi:hypothetical protein
MRSDITIRRTGFAAFQTCRCCIDRPLEAYVASRSGEICCPLVQASEVVSQTDGAGGGLGGARMGAFVKLVRKEIWTHILVQYNSFGPPVLPPMFHNLPSPLKSATLSPDKPRKDAKMGGPEGYLGAHRFSLCLRRLPTRMVEYGPRFN